MIHLLYTMVSRKGKKSSQRAPGGAQDIKETGIGSEVDS